MDLSLIPVDSLSAVALMGHVLIVCGVFGVRARRRRQPKWDGGQSKLDCVARHTAERMCRDVNRKQPESISLSLSLRVLPSVLQSFKLGDSFNQHWSECVPGMGYSIPIILLVCLPLSFLLIVRLRPCRWPPACCWLAGWLIGMLGMLLPQGAGGIA